MTKLQAVNRRKDDGLHNVFDPKADSPLPDNLLREKRNRYANFDSRNIVARIAEKSLGASIIRVEPLGIGANAFDHLVFRAYTDKGLKVVFRLNVDTLIAEGFLVEAAIYNTWHKSGVPSPEVYDLALRSRKDDPDYMLLENVGTNDIEKHLNQYPQDVHIYGHSAGSFLRRIHSIPVRGFGNLKLKSNVLQGIHTTWREAIHIRLEENLNYILKHHLLNLKQEKEIRKAFELYDELLELENGVTLHGDYHNANIMIDDVNKKVVAAIDLSNAKSGDPIYDIAFYGTYVSPEVFDSFCDGYFNKSHRPTNFAKKIALYQLRIYISKAKLRKRFGYDDRIDLAIDGIDRSLKILLKST